MHDTDAFSQLPLSAPKERTHSVLQAERPQTAAPVKAVAAEKPRGLFARMFGWLGGLFVTKKEAVAVRAVDPVAAERAATSRAAHMPEPVAFRSENASTLATPVSVYAGKPVEQAIRKRAEQQFKAMDITQSTVH